MPYSMVHMQHSTNNTNGTKPHNPATDNLGFCDGITLATFQRLSNDTACVALMQLMESDDPGMAQISQMCRNNCWQNMISELTNLHSLGCLEGLTPEDMSAVCEPLEECATPVAATCVDTWVRAGCPDAATAGCERYAICGFASQSRCPQDGAPVTPSTDVITFVLSLPLTMDPAVFRARFITPFVAALAQSSGCSDAQVTISSVTRGSVVVSGEIVVSPSNAPLVFGTLDLNLKNKKFTENLNQQLAGQLIVANTTRILLTTTSTLPAQTPAPV